MPKRIAPKPVAVVLVTALLLAGCARHSYGSAKARDDLIEIGFTREEATCIVRGMERRLKAERLGAREEPADYERRAFGEIVEYCVGGPGA